MDVPRSLLLTSNDGAQSGRSGYDVLASYVPHGTTLACRRQDPRNHLERALRWWFGRRAASSWYMLSSRRLERMGAEALRRGRFDLVHMLWADRDWGVMDRICRRQGVPFVATVHACPDELAAILPHPRRYREAAAIILMSPHQREFFLGCGVPAERLHVIPHGIDIEHFQPSGVRREASPLEILSVGQYRRNLPLLERLIAALETDERFRFTLVTRPHLREIFGRYRNVRFLSGLSNEALLRTYQESDLLVITAEDATANNALVEGMACGLPVVCERVGGLPEYAPAGCAIHTEPNSLEALVAALVGLAEDPARRMAMSAAARARAEALAWEHSVEQLLEVYRGVVGARSGESGVR